MASTLYHRDYSIAWVCALPLEMAAAKAMLDEYHPPLPQPPTDHNTYALGNINGHAVVIACLPYGVYGTIAAATVMAEMRATFPCLQFGLMVGIGGGVPSRHADIRLGDVVISKPSATSSGVIQYDFGKTVQGGRIERTGALNKPPPILLTAMAHVESNRILGKETVTSIVHDVLKSNEEVTKFRPPGEDWLFSAGYLHTSGDSGCSACDQDQLVVRPGAEGPNIHYGLIASGNQVIKDGQTRDRIAEAEEILCFEMEAAGLMDQLPCLVIRGICDYCDSHKHKAWQGYAALTAAAYTKQLLSAVPLTNLQIEKGHKKEPSPDEKACLQSLFITDPFEDKNALKRRKGDRAPGTCKWIIETEELQSWIFSHDAPTVINPVLWLHGNPGIGKSTMAIALVEELSDRSDLIDDKNILTYFFCDSSSPERCSAVSILRGLLYQLIKQRPQLVSPLLHKFQERKEKLFDSFDALWAILLDIGRENTTGRLYCIIDALDECDQESQKILLAQIKQSFGNENKGMSDSIHFLITSRPYPEIREHLYPFISKDLSSYQNVQDDLRVLIDQKVSELSQTKHYSERIKQEVSDILQKKAEGTFLWVGIACDDLARVRSRDAVKRLQNLPQGLYSLYAKLLEMALERTEKEDNETILQLLTVVAIARRPLTVEELSIACGTYEDEDEEHRLMYSREDIDMCRLMVVVQNGIVRLLHKSVKDFLLISRDANSSTNELKTHASLANRCVGHLLNNIKTLRGEADEWQDTFLEYAIVYWPEHAGIAGREFTVQAAYEDFFSIESKNREIWLDAYRKRRYLPKQFSLLHVAARWGIKSIIDFLSKNRESQEIFVLDWDNFQTENGITPLEEATRASQIDIVRWLLEEPEIPVKVTPRVIQAAAGNSHYGKDIMALFFNKRGDQIKITGKMVKPAAGNRYNGKEVLELFLKNRKDEVIITDEVVKAAAGNWDKGKDIMKLLLNECGDEIRITEKVTKMAAGNWNHGKGIMELLLNERGDQIKITEEVVKAAAGNRNNGKEVITLLLDKRGNEIEITEDVIKAAARNEESGPEIMTLLLKHRGTSDHCEEV